MPTWQQLRDLDWGRLNDAADGWGAVSNAADAARDRVSAEMTNALEKSQEGEGAKAAVRRLRRLNENFDYAYIECGLVRTSLNSLAFELRSPQRRLGQALEDAAAMKFAVGADGSVSYPAGGESLIDGSKAPGGTVAGRSSPLAARPSLDGRLPAGGPSPLLNANPNHAKAEAIADAIAHAVLEAQQIDRRFSQALNRLKAKPGLRVDKAAWTDTAGDAAAVRGVAGGYLKDNVPIDASPVERNTWWHSLTEEQREEYLAVYPNVVGNLDGIPAAVRDEANRDNLTLLIGKLEGDDSEKAKSQLAGLRSIEGQLAANTEEQSSRRPKEPPMLLLGVGDEGRGRAVVAFGNPDSTKHVSAYVPGLGTALDEKFATNDVQRARDTAINAQKLHPSSSSIVWLGYDAPQIAPDAETLLGNLDVMSTASADAGAPAFNSFMAGLSATNGNEDPHVTAIGHSYGSRLVGAATQAEGGIPAADDIILLGSPGVGVDRAEELGVGKDHVYVGAAENDPVTTLPSKPEVVAGAAAVVIGGSYAAGDIADQGDDDIWFGKDPASAAFGATRFVVDDGPLPVVDGKGPTPAHSNYFNPKSVEEGGDPKSAANIAAVIAGRSDLLTTEQHR
ncbi:alpha/beta hydrolase [Streptomyces sp. NPDC017556]|uniref:alpha/beta hydrolase n=1 Tax=Streptomyces sp. NPDC017556 TaxID=3365002 RepID=UPI0037A8F7B8